MFSAFLGKDLTVTPVSRYLAVFMELATLWAWNANARTTRNTLVVCATHVRHWPSFKLWWPLQFDISAICTNPCMNGGVCSAPNTCTCASGWEGSTCDKCIDLEGCEHGSCIDANGDNIPHSCNCNEGYTGALCNEPDCNPACEPDKGRCVIGKDVSLRTASVFVNVCILYFRKDLKSSNWF